MLGSVPDYGVGAFSLAVVAVVVFLADDKFHSYFHPAAARDANRKGFETILAHDSP
jgi:hypothetical protein